MLRSEPVTDEDPREEVLILGALGTFLIFAYGLATLVIGVTITAPAEFGQDALTVGLAGVALSIVLGILLFAYYGSTDSEVQSTLSLLIATFSAFSLWVGGGFVVGFILAFTGGVLGIVLAHLPRPPSNFFTTTAGPRPAPGSGPEPALPTAPRPAGPAKGDRVASSWTPGQETVVWFCMKCDGVNSIDQQSCRKCGAPRGTRA